MPALRNSKKTQRNVCKIGFPAPVFNSRALIDGKIKDISLNDIYGSWLILFFFLSDATKNCADEINTLNEHYHQFEHLNTKIVIISVNTFDENQLFNLNIEKNGTTTNIEDKNDNKQSEARKRKRTNQTKSGKKILTKIKHEDEEKNINNSIPIIFDPQNLITQAYGIISENVGIVQRAVFIIDPDGYLQQMTLRSSNTSESVDALLHLVQCLQQIPENVEEETNPSSRNKRKKIKLDEDPQESDSADERKHENNHKNKKIKDDDVDEDEKDEQRKGKKDNMTKIHKFTEEEKLQILKQLAIPLKLPIETLKKSDRKFKKYQIEHNGKIIHFGDTRYEDFLDHHDHRRRFSYLSRATGIRNKNGQLTYLDKSTANYYSVHLLWGDFEAIS